MAETSIEWTHRPGTRGVVWNPTRGCRVVSPGCEACYAMRQAHRFSGKGGTYEGLTQLRHKGPVWTGSGRLVVDMLDLPLRWRKPRTVFVNSMSDLFFEKFTADEIAAVFGVMAACPQHVFQVLTKRPQRMADWFRWVSSGYGMGMRAQELITMKASGILEYRDGKNIDPLLDNHTRAWPLPNVWLGCSVENQKYADERIPLLLETPAAVRFLSYEPALGPIDWTTAAWDLEDLSWVVVGGESGPGARPFCQDWAKETIGQCRAAGVACFFKQYGSVPVDGEGVAITLKDRKGGDVQEWPKDLRVRQWPEART